MFILELMQIVSLNTKLVTTCFILHCTALLFNPGIVQRVKTILENIDEILAMCDVPLIWFALSTSVGSGSKVCFLFGSFTNKLTYLSQTDNFPSYKQIDSSFPNSSSIVFLNKLTSLLQRDIAGNQKRLELFILFTKTFHFFIC